MEFTPKNDHVILIDGAGGASHPPSPTLKNPPPTSPHLASAVGKWKMATQFAVSKPKSRFCESNRPPPAHRLNVGSDRHEPLKNDGQSSSSSASDYDDDESYDEDGEEGETNGDTGKRRKPRRRGWKVNKRAVLEWTLFMVIIASLLCSLTLKVLKEDLVMGLHIWKWCLMILVTFCGRLVSGWVVAVLVFVIERNFMLREKVLYFVYGLRRSVQNCAWLGLVLCAWIIIFPNVHKQNKMMRRAFHALVAILISATIWLIKIIFVKVLASSFHVAAFFDRMKESVFHHYILDTLSGPPLDETAIVFAQYRRSKSMPARRRSRTRSRRFDAEKLRKLSMETRGSAWSVKRLVNYVRSSGLTTISTMVDDFGKAEITSEWEARNSAQRIFKNVAKPNARYIEEDDLLRFFIADEVSAILPLFEGAAEAGRITKSSFRNWVVHAYTERKALAHSLNDTKTAVQQLHKLASAIVFVVIVVMSLLVMGVATTKVIFVVTSQLLLVGFMFQNTCKTIFESIVFVFVMHPFDVGDRCVVEGVQMVVEEMNILTTVFLRYDMEKIYYPNSVLLTKPISNFRRSPEMSESINFSINVSTSIEKLNMLKKAIQTYLESKPKHWNPKHSLFVKEIEDINKMSMSLCVQHTMNHQNVGERYTRMTELMLELKRIFESLDIKYHLLPQEIHLTRINNIPTPSMQ
ncbi:hypothetical protein MLD38_037386 [Melastoma candidum]|uniref:Uncharacterized protein n=1 Tax=Melastoma candidum TaxID=119954 RepID=A0ACB9LM62_9MYRT|nr:hypothetical protein MLD38_037386 [Melastoma candidum]